MSWSAQLGDDFFDEAESEHITISSEPVEEEVRPDTSSQTNCQFRQASAVRNENRSFRIFDERFLAVCIEQPSIGKTEYQFNLAFLDPTPQRFSGVAWRWLYAALALTAISLAVFWLMGLSDTPLLEQRWLPAGVLSVVSAIIIFLVFVYRTSFTLTFYSLHGRVPLLELAARSPTRTAVENFVFELQKRIEAAREAHWKEKPQFLRDEIRLHYRLWEEGILPDDVYEPGKLRILAAHD